MIKQGDLVEVGFEGTEEKMTGEVLKKDGHTYKVHVIHASKELDNFKNKEIIVNLHPLLKKSKIKKLTINEDVDFEKQKLQQLIDISLEMKDQGWFAELSDRLKWLNKKQK